MSNIVNSSREVSIDYESFLTFQEAFNNESNLRIQQLESLISNIENIGLPLDPTNLIPIQDLISYETSSSEIPLTEIYHFISRNIISMHFHKTHTTYLDPIPLNVSKILPYSSIFRSNLPIHCNFLYVVGGMSDLGVVSNEISKFDFKTGAFSFVACMKHKRHSCATIGYKSLVFIIGGIGAKGDGNDIIEYFDMNKPGLLGTIETDQRKRTQTSATLFNKKIYIVSEDIKFLHVLDPETKTVTNIKFYNTNFSLRLVCCWGQYLIVFTDKNKVHILNQQHQIVKIMDYACQTKWTQESISENARGVYFVDYVTEDEHEIVLEGFL